MKFFLLFTFSLLLYSFNPPLSPFLYMQFVEPTGKRFLLALDVSGSMTCPVMGSRVISCRDASAAMAMVTGKLYWHLGNDYYRNEIFGNGIKQCSFCDYTSSCNDYNLIIM